ncbi:inositol hexakisphosphate kinase 2 [Gadus morhua]|uniref:Kinase n=1 Tax=Gadus morhua TaxID=8049 RepID=A0A8C5CE59_GADMO|nr:inositol hexakisphosphate kinase 2-like [Gadus morhua]
MSPAVDAQGRGGSGAEPPQKLLQPQQPQPQPQPQHCYLEKGVMLEPFIHQVGGHSCVLRFGEQTICKPLIPREYQFYKSLPPPMREFTPQYRGVVSVSFEEDDEGNLCLIAYPLHSDQETKELAVDSQPKNKILQWVNDNQAMEVCSHNSQKDKDESVQRRAEKVELEWLQQAEVLYYRLERSKSSALTQHNPWSLQCHQKHLQTMKDNAKQRNQYRFILLENLTWRHAVPCVLDLKMGTRQHGDDASEEKKALHMRKCQQSTSATIGVRLGGMQVYRSDSGQLMFMNKYHGRKLSLPGFKEALFQFFHDGLRLRGELLSPVLRRLQQMQAALAACESYRFYSSSLLIIYDGEPRPGHARRRRRSEHGLSEEEEEEEEEEDEDEEDEDKAGDEGAGGLEEDNEDGEGEEVSVAGALGFAHGSPPPGSASCSGGGASGGTATGRQRAGPSDPRRPSVDVRMIDFAHTTCRDYREDSVVHEGQDSGYIFGLQNLITIISELEEHSSD